MCGCVCAAVVTCNDMSWALSWAQAMEDCLGSPEDWADLWRASGREDMRTHVPIIVHEDAVPHFSGPWAEAVIL